MIRVTLSVDDLPPPPDPPAGFAPDGYTVEFEAIDGDASGLLVTYALAKLTKTIEDGFKVYAVCVRRDPDGDEWMHARYHPVKGWRAWVAD